MHYSLQCNSREEKWKKQRGKAEAAPKAKGCHLNFITEGETKTPLCPSKLPFERENLKKMQDYTVRALGLAGLLCPSFTVMHKNNQSEVSIALQHNAWDAFAPQSATWFHLLLAACWEICTEKIKSWRVLQLQGGWLEIPSHTCILPHVMANKKRHIIFQFLNICMHAGMKQRLKT